jgi:hypothetical protein
VIASVRAYARAGQYFVAGRTDLVTMDHVTETGYGDHQQDCRHRNRGHQFEQAETMLTSWLVDHHAHQQLPLVL